MKTLKNLFTSEDFSRGDNLVGTQYAADKAQLILDQFIEENGVKVTGWVKDGLFGFSNKKDSISPNYDNRSAILICIEPIKQCEHRTAVYVQNKNRESWFECISCGKPVKAKGWETV